MVTLATANAYFGATRHIHFFIWSKYDQNAKTAALYQANEILTRALGYEPEDDATDTTDLPRADRAVFEQALYMLRQSPLIADGGQPAPHFDGGLPRDAMEPRDGANPYAVCPEAMRWLQGPRSESGATGLVSFSRG